MSAGDKPKKTKASWNDIKKALKGHGRESLLGLISDLYNYSADNKNFLHARFSGSTEALKPFKKIIKGALYPNPEKDDDVRIADAKRAISDYRKAIGDPRGLLELMLFFVETGTAFTVEFGDMDENFYFAHERMYKKAIDMLLTLGDEAVDEYYDRFRKVVVDSDGIGWGYNDALADIFAEAFPDENEADPLR